MAELRSHAPERIVDAVWGESYSAGYSLVVRVVANDRSGLLRDITTILANEKVNVLGVASRSDTKQQLATIDMTIEIYNLQVLGRVLGKLNQVPDVIDASVARELILHSWIWRQPYPAISLLEGITPDGPAIFRIIQ